MVVPELGGLARQSGTDWMLIGILLTALFTGIVAVGTVMLYRHERQLVGVRRPIKIGRPKPVGVHRFPDEDDWEHISDAIKPIFRVVTLYIYNRSAVPQTITFDSRKSRVI